jgi:hypothetical protein
VRAAPFWLVVAGGMLLAASSLVGSSALDVVGAVLFVLGTVLFFVVAVRRSWIEGTRFPTALARSARDALRFARFLMP